MDEESLHVRYLIVIAAVLCALIIGYNAFYVPDASMATLTVAADASSLSGEEYTPRAPASSGLPSVSGLTSGSTVKDSAAAGSGKPSVSGKINLNTATAQEISDGLDGIGEVMARRIVDYRNQNGRFKSIEEIKNVSGIGDKTFAKMKDHITV
jgi:competence protein ComEA